MRLPLPFLLALAAGGAVLSAQEGEPRTAVEWNEAGARALQEGRVPEAVEAFRRARALAPGDPVLRLNLARALGHRARELAAAGRLEEALRSVREGRALDRDGGSLEVLEARFHLRLGDRARAREVLDAVLREFPEQPEALALRAEVASLDGDPAAGVAFLERAVAVRPGDTALQQRLERLREEARALAGFLTDATAHFDLRYDPHLPWIVERIPRLGALLEEAFQAVHRSLGFAPEDRIVVLVLDRERYAGDAPEWSGGLYDGRIRLPQSREVFDEAELASALRHETTHAALHRIGPAVPAWLHEGLAQAVEGRSVTTARRLLRRDPGAWPSLGELRGGWTAWTDRRRVEAAYAYALSLAWFLQEEYGANAWSLLLGQLRRRGFDEAFPATFAASLEAVDVRHRQALAAGD